MADINPYAGGSIPSNIYTKKEEGYATKIKEATKEQKENRKKNVNSSGPGNIPSDVYTKKDSGYTTKGNAEKTRRTDEKRTFGERNKAFFNNLAADVFGDRAYDYGNYSDSTLKSMAEKNPGSQESILAQRELNKRNEAAGMAKKDVMMKGADGEMKDMTFSTGNTIEDKKLYGDTPASEIPGILKELGYDPHTVSNEQAAQIIKNRQNTPATTSAPAPSTPSAGGIGTAPANPASATTDEAALSNGISTDEPTEDLSAPWKDTDEAVESIKNDINNKAAATPEMKSIWQAWKNGDIDKATRNYFLADAIAKFAGDMGNISHAQHANNMWANIESGNQINPMENVKGENQWQDYLKTDWKEAQKLKNEARSKEQLGNIDNQLEVSKQRGFDKYLANEKPEILKDSKWAKMAKEDPNNYAVLMQLGQMVDGKSPLTADQLGNLIDAAGNAKLGNDIGAKQLEMLGLTKQQAEESLQALKFANELNNATKQYQILAQKYGVDSVQAQNAAMWAQTAGQNLDNTLKSKTMNSNIRKAIGEANNTLYGNTKVNVGAFQTTAGNLASAGQEGYNLTQGAY